MYTSPCLLILNANIITKSLFEHLPERLTGARGSTTARNKRAAPSPNRLGSRDVSNIHDSSRSEPVVMNQRATTFPITRSIYENDSRLRINTVSNPDLGQNFQELLSPTDVSFTNTPSSIGTDPSIQYQKYPMPQSFGCIDRLPDVNAMMFSEDPFAYPNQPMIQFDNIKQENIVDFQDSSLSLPNGGDFDDLEGQFFGPIPPYMMQGQQNFDVSGQINAENILSGLGPQQMTFNYMPNTNLNFDNILAGDGNDWSDLFIDQRRT